MVEIFEESPLTNCLFPLLQSLNWKGTSRQLAEVMPYCCYEFTIFSFQKIMRRLHFGCEHIDKLDISHIDSRLLPCLFISSDGGAYVIKSVSENCAIVYNGETQTSEEICSVSMIGEVYLFHPIKDDQATEKSIGKHIWNEHHNIIIHMFFLGIMLNLLYLSVPLFIMGVYDSFIATQSYDVLWSLSIGMAIALVFMFLMLYVRDKAIAYVTVHVDSTIMSNIFNKLLNLPPAYIETAAVSSQIAQLKNFDLIYHFLSSRLVGMLLELPFIIVLLIVIGILGGYLVLIPMGMVFLYIVLLLISLTKIQIFVREMASLNAEKQDFIIESLSRFHDIRYYPAVDRWCEKFRELSADASLSSFKLNLLVGIISIVSDFIMIASGVLLIYYGVTMATSGLITMGALIAIFILIWRTLAPLRTIASSIITFEQVHNCLQQLNRLMSLKTEVGSERQSGIFEYDNANIRVDSLIMRYQYNMPIVLQNINFEIKQGEILAVVGSNGAGKSTLLKLILGLYQPQAGAIYIDEKDIRQVDPYELRHAISYIPQHDTLFYGTIMQNFYLVDPIATVEDIYAAAKLAGAYEDIMGLENGFNTFLDDHRISFLPDEFKRKICLARAFIKKSKLLLLDGGQLDLNQKYDQEFSAAMKLMSEDRTIIYTTHNREKLQVADKILYLEHGRQIVFGPKDEVISMVYRKM